MAVPTGQEVCQKQLLALMHKVREVTVNEQEIGTFLPAVYDELKDLSKDELIKRFASIEFNRFLDYYRNAVDLNQDTKGESAGDGTVYGSRFFINLGKMDGFEKGDLLSFLDDTCGVDGRSVGRIDLKGAYSFFEVTADKADSILQGMKDVNHRGRQIRVEMTDRSDRGARHESSRRSYSQKKSTSSKKKTKFSEHRKKRY
jgi:ATP-dependent RNA helicase DeaD